MRFLKHKQYEIGWPKMQEDVVFLEKIRDSVKQRSARLDSP